MGSKDAQGVSDKEVMYSKVVKRNKLQDVQKGLENLFKKGSMCLRQVKECSVLYK